jgi:hypothetical protein
MICQDELDWNETLIKRYVGREVGDHGMFITVLITNLSFTAIISRLKVIHGSAEAIMNNISLWDFFYFFILWL